MQIEARAYRSSFAHRASRVASACVAFATAYEQGRVIQRSTGERSF